MVDIVIRKKEQFRQLWENAIKPKIMQGLEGGPVLVRLTRETKSRLQEQKYHAMINDIGATACIKINGATADLSNPAVAKALLISWYEYELNEIGETLSKPSQKVFDLIRCELITVRASSKDFTVKEGAGFIEFLHKIGAEYGAKWSERTLSYDQYPELNQ